MAPHNTFKRIPPTFEQGFPNDMASELNKANTPEADNRKPLLALLGSVHQLHRALRDWEAEPIKRTIPEEEAENMASEVSSLVLEYFPDLDPEMVSQAVSNCVQDRVEPAKHTKNRQIEPVSDLIYEILNT
jgi:hypothetical protein